MVWLWIGVYLGFLVVGDIGVLECVNYIVIGDMVNIVVCFESFGKDVDLEVEVVILVFGEVVYWLSMDLSCEVIGFWKIKG